MEELTAKKEELEEKNKNTQAEATEEDQEKIKKQNEEVRQRLKELTEQKIKKGKEANEVMSQGKGRLELEIPITAGDEEIKELAYDFTELTGMEYADAMDSDLNAQQVFRITYRQGLALFAKAAAKQTEKIDERDIVERMGMTDAVEAVQLATLFFSASTRAGRLRISKK